MPGLSSKHPARVRICRKIADTLDALHALEGNGVLPRGDCTLYGNFLRLYRSEISESNDETECPAIGHARRLLSEVSDFARDRADYDPESPDAEGFEVLLSQISEAGR